MPRARDTTPYCPFSINTVHFWITVIRSQLGNWMIIPSDYKKPDAGKVDGHILGNKSHTKVESK